MIIYENLLLTFKEFYICTVSLLPNNKTAFVQTKLMSSVHLV